MAPPILAILEVLAGIGCVYLAVCWYRSITSRVPGPLLATLGPFYRLYLVYSGHCNLKIRELHKRYGTVVKVGPDYLVTSDPDVLPTFYNTGKGWRKSDFYKVWDMDYEGVTYENSISARDPASHRQITLEMAGHLSSTHLKSYETVVTEITRTFVQKMRIDTGKPIDLAKWAKYWAYDVSFAVATGEVPGFVATGSDLFHIAVDVDTVFRVGTRLAPLPWMLLRFLRSKAMMKINELCTGNSDPLLAISKVIKQNLATANNTPREQLPTSTLSWLSAQSELSPNAVDDRVKVIRLATEVIAGGVSGSNVVGAVIYHLIQDPRVHRLVLNELRGAEFMGSTAVTKSNPITYERILQLPYFQAVIKETFRLHPPDIVLERVVPPPGVTLSGHFVPAGTVVGVSPWVISRDPAIYGSDVDDFRPERWLEASKEQLSQMHKCKLSFSRGERACSGKALGLMMVNIFVAHVLYELDVEWAGDPQGWNLRGYFNPEQRGLVVRFFTPGHNRIS